MEFTETFPIKGRVEATLYDEHGNVKTRRKVNNLVVQVGRDLIAAGFHGTASDRVTHIAVGSNSPESAAAIGQTALVSPLAPRRATGAGTLQSNPATITYTYSFIAGQNTGSIGEAGLFTALTSGTMVARTTFPAIPKGASDVLIVTWTLLFG